MLLSIQNKKSSNACFNLISGKTVTLAPEQMAIINCPPQQFKYYLGLASSGFALNSDEEYILSSTLPMAIVEKIKEVEKIVEVPVAVVREVIKEVPVVKEVPVEVIKEVEKIVEKPVEIIREVIIERPVVSHEVRQEASKHSDNAKVEKKEETSMDNTPVKEKVKVEVMEEPVEEKEEAVDSIVIEAAETEKTDVIAEEPVIDGAAVDSTPVEEPVKVRNKPGPKPKAQTVVASSTDK